MEDLVDKLSVRETVSLPGWIPNPLPYLRSATVLASASFSEGFSMVVVEALGVGLPVVSTDCLGPSEILDHGRYGLVVPVNDDKALAAALRRVLCDNALRSRLSAAGPERARQFSPERAAKEWEHVLTSACPKQEKNFHKLLKLFHVAKASG
jgi:glycosyltransferase involved in cell wall biosynthesis